ncbi:peptidoglycan DD-metalloendopeptidase family protein [Patescibacteria group bacterium]|nr:peptidoglycan DD-metalloendopeptidase family protein [Patescibacteria group bacterium]
MLLFVFLVTLLCGCITIPPGIVQDRIAEDTSVTDPCAVFPELCEGEDNGMTDGVGGDGNNMPTLTLPFASGEYWNVTQTYNPSNNPNSSHRDYGGTYSDDRFAIDYTQSGCNSYGKGVLPVAPGTVTQVEQDNGSGTGYGNSVIVEHDNGYYSRYAHLGAVFVNVGDEVDGLDYIGKVGNTGFVSGVACADHPGSHLHFAVYKDGNGIKPEPMSGVDGILVGCWYNREGGESCNGNPGDYYNFDDEGFGIEDYGELVIPYLEVNPEIGTASETNFVWTAIIVSPELRPEATLWIYNPVLDERYSFEMDTQSRESPWVFTYRKTLSSDSTFDYWVRADNGDGNSLTPLSRVSVAATGGSGLHEGSLSWTPDDGFAEATMYTWTTTVTSAVRPTINLAVVNPNDAMIYFFPMTVSGSGPLWYGEFSSTLRDPTIYTFWAVASDGITSDTSGVGSLDNGSDDWGLGRPDAGDSGDPTVQADTGLPVDTGTLVDTGSPVQPPVQPSCDYMVPSDFGTVQGAVDAAVRGDVICVSAGTYFENLRFDGDGITVISLDGAAATVLDGGASDDVVRFTNGSTSVLDGFTVRNGMSSFGGGIYISGASPEIRHCVVTANDMYGMTVRDSAAPVVMNTIISQNAFRGVYVQYSAEPEFVNVVVASNGSSGMSVYNDSVVTLVSSIVYGNRDYGVYVQDAQGTLVSSYNDVWGNGLGDFAGASSASASDFSSDPSFSDLSWYRLTGGSVCVDSGDPAAAFNDVDGSRNDVGAYGGSFGSW